MKEIQKVFLISLPAVLEEVDTYLEDGHSFHLSLAYLAAVIRTHGLEVTILDSYAEDRSNLRPDVEPGWLELGLSDEQILDRIASADPDLIGITVPFTCQQDLAVKLAEKIKSRFSHVVLVAGGNHITGYVDDKVLDIFDYRVLGEGEYALLELICSLNQDEEERPIAGVLQRGGAQSSRVPYIQDLDQLPFPALDLLPLEKIWGSGRRWINMIATRGCIYRCVFCSIHTVMGHTIRRRSVENIVAEIAHWKRKYNIQEIYFEDDNLTVNHNWAKSLFQAIAERKFGIRMHVRNGVRADSLDEELLKLMKAAGFQDISISPESGSQNTLTNIIHKTQNLEDCLRVLKLARKLHLGVNSFFVMGFPEETWDDLEQTVQFARHLRDLGCSGFWFSLVTPFPGTELYDSYRKSGHLPDSFDFRKLRSVDYVIQNPHYSARELKAFRKSVMEELAPSTSWLKRGIRILALALQDPEFFWVKLRCRMPSLLKSSVQWVHVPKPSWKLLQRSTGQRKDSRIT